MAILDKSFIKAVLLLISGILLVNCGGSSGHQPRDGNDPAADEPVLLSEMKVDFPGVGVLQAEYDGNGQFMLLTEELPLIDVYPGLRSFEILDDDGNINPLLESTENDRLIEAVVDKDFVYATYIQYDGEQELLLLRKFDLSGQQLLQTTLLNDSKTGIDERILVRSGARARLKVGEERVYTAIYTNRQKVVLQVYQKDDFSEALAPIAVETEDRKGSPGQSSASYDAFQQIMGRFKACLDIDDDENIYIAVANSWGLVGNVDNGSIISKYDSHGSLIYQVRSPYAEDENLQAAMQSFNVKGDKILITGRRLEAEDRTQNEWDPYLEVYDLETGALIFHGNYTLDGENAIFFGADLDDSTQSIFVGGSVGWTQNETGASVSATGDKILLAVDALSGTELSAVALTSGPRQNQVRSVQVYEDFLIIGGWENGPGTHSGDADPSLVNADGFLQVVLK